MKNTKIDRSFSTTKEAIRDLEAAFKTPINPDFECLFQLPVPQPERQKAKILQHWSYRGKLYIKIDHWNRIYFDGFNYLKDTPGGKVILVSKETSDRAIVKQAATLEARDHYDNNGNWVKGTRTLAKEYASNLKDKLSVLEGDFVDYLDEWNNDKRETREDDTDEFDNTPFEIDTTRPLYELAGNSYREDFSQRMQFTDDVGNELYHKTCQINGGGGGLQEIPKPQL